MGSGEDRYMERDKENQGGQQRRGRRERKRAQTIGHPANLNKSAYVLESQSLSVVPWFKRTPLPRNSPRLKWSINEATQQPTITRSESYACTLRWSRTPPLESLPLPPAKWLKEMRDSEEKKDAAEVEQENICSELEKSGSLAQFSSSILSTPRSGGYEDSVSDSGYSQGDSQEGDSQEGDSPEVDSQEGDGPEINCEDINSREADSQDSNIQEGDRQTDCCSAESLLGDMAVLNVGNMDDGVVEFSQSSDLAGSDLAGQSGDLSSQSCVMLQSILSSLVKRDCEEIQ